VQRLSLPATAKTELAATLQSGRFETGKFNSTEMQPKSLQIQITSFACERGAPPPDADPEHGARSQQNFQVENRTTCLCGLA
jgi:hypothetical protein